MTTKPVAYSNQRNNLSRVNGPAKRRLFCGTRADSARYDSVTMTTATLYPFFCQTNVTPLSFIEPSVFTDNGFEPFAALNQNKQVIPQTVLV